MIFGAILFSGCASEGNGRNPEKDTPESEEKGPESGKKRLYIRFRADDELLEKGIWPKDLSSKIIRVNGLDYRPGYSRMADKWFVDADESSFGVYSAQMLEDRSPSWYGESPTSDIFIPSAQFLHHQEDLRAIPLLAEYDSSVGDYLDFMPPYAVLLFEISGQGHPLSLSLSSSSPSCGKVSWRRSTRAFEYDGRSGNVVLNCTEESSATGQYPMFVFGSKLEDVSLRVCDDSHRMQTRNLGVVELEPGMLKKYVLNMTPDRDLLWFEGFDRCVWGGDTAGGSDGYSPTALVPSLRGDDSLLGYEYASVPVVSSIPGSGYVQYAFGDTSPTVIEEHCMSDSYVTSRGFTAYKYMLRCREHPGYISVGTGSTFRGVFSLFPLEGIRTVKNIEVSFRICIDPAANDDVQFLTTGSSAVIKEWHLDGAGARTDAMVQKGTWTSLRLGRDNLGGAGEWHSVRVLMDNCTDASLIQWQAASSEPGNHGFYLDEIAVREMPGWERDGKLRLLYWNIQNGMWSDQGNGYEHFVNFVNAYSPDICVWCEARSNYQTGSDIRIEEEEQAYLPTHWSELAARYGHQYVAVSRRGNEGFPQVITSRFPVEKLRQMETLPGGAAIMHGAGVFKLITPAGDDYFVTLHLNPYPENDDIRLDEIRTILEASVLDASYSGGRGWFVLGDFNSHSRVDADNITATPDRPLLFAVHDYIADNTALIDLSATRYPGSYTSTTSGMSRFDYIYMDAKAYARVKDAGVISTAWTQPVFTEISNFYWPSDHRPILVDLEN